MRLNGSRVPYRFPTSNVAVKSGKASMEATPDTDIFAEVFFVTIEPGAGLSAKAVVIKPPRIDMGADGGLAPAAGRNRYDWITIDPSGKPDIDSIRVKYLTQSIDATAEQYLDPIRVKYASQVIEGTALGDMTGDISIWARWSGSGDLDIVSSPIVYDSVIFDATGESIFGNIRQRIHSPSFNPTAVQDIHVLRQRKSSSSLSSAVEQSLSSKVLKLFSPIMEATGEQIVTPKIIGFAYPTFDAKAEQDLVGSVEFSLAVTMQAQGTMDIESEIQQLISKLEYHGDLEPGDLLTIDVKNKTVKVNGENMRHNFEGDFLKLRKGLNKLEYWDDESDRNLEITLEYEPRWL